jgi:hypothetical protein
MNYNSILKRIVAIPLVGLVLAGAEGPQMKVFKTRTCGCCGKWVEHLKANGFKVVVQDVADTAESRMRYGVPNKLQSCHTAVVNGYFIEGHVPAREIRRLLNERPKAKGLVVPGMPAGSPGMEGSRNDAYAVLLFDALGRLSVYQNYPDKGNH